MTGKEQRKRLKAELDALKTSAPEVLRYGRKQKGKKLLRILGADLLILAVTVFDYPIYAGKSYARFVWLIGVLGVFLVGLNFRPRGLLTERSYLATVRAVGFDTDYAEQKGMEKLRYMSVKEEEDMLVFAEDERGKSVYFRLDPLCERAFTPGDRILHVAGVPYPVNLDEKNNTHRVCPFCGNVMPKENRYCVGCGAGKENRIGE